MEQKIRPRHPEKVNKPINPIKKKPKWIKSKLIKSNTRVIFTESPGSLTFEMQDLPSISKVARKAGATVITDNTWASPIFCNPVKLGINIIIDAGTKYINGHSDVLIGFVSSDKKHSKEIRITAKTLGMCPGSEEL